MATQPVRVREPTAPLSPLVIDSPHSGRQYPADFKYVCSPALLRQAEDFHVDELVSGGLSAGATVIIAEFPRSYIDVNRAENDIDPNVLMEPWPGLLAPSMHTLQGLGLVRRLCRSGVPVYAAPLHVEEILARLEHYYRPYHAALETAVARRVALFGESCLLNLHSMPDGEARSARPDFVLGDRMGTSCDVALTRRVREILQDMGYSVVLNDPYQGREIVARYGKPDAGRHALQIEINRRLYMDEQRLEKCGGFEELQINLTALFAAVARARAVATVDRAAAE